MPNEEQSHRKRKIPIKWKKVLFCDMSFLFLNYFAAFLCSRVSFCRRFYLHFYKTHNKITKPNTQQHILPTQYVQIASSYWLVLRNNSKQNATKFKLKVTKWKIHFQLKTFRIIRGIRKAFYSEFFDNGKIWRWNRDGGEKQRYVISL